MTLTELGQEYRDAHAQYEQWRSRGIPAEQIPRHVLERERVYQRVAKRDRRQRQKEAR